MEGQESIGGPLPEDLEFERRFMSSCPNTDNPFWWPREHNSLEQQLPDFIPIPNDGGESHQSVASQTRWNAERLNIDPPSSRSIIYGSGDSQHMEFETSSAVRSGSNNLPYQPAVGTYQGSSNGSSSGIRHNNLNQPVDVESSVNEFISTDLRTNDVPSGQASTNQIAISSSSAHNSMNVLQTGIILREENSRSSSGVKTTHSSDKRKSPEGYREESSAMSSKRSGQITGSSGLHATLSGHIPSGSFSLPSSSANIYGLDSPETLSSGTIPSLTPRSSLFEIPSQQGTTRSSQHIGQTSRSRTNSPVQGLVQTNFLSPGTVTPPSQAVEEGSNVQNQRMTAQSPVTLQHGGNGSRNIATNLTRPDFSPVNAQMEEIGFRNRSSTDSLQLPVIASPVDPSYLAYITMNFGSSGGAASMDVNTNLDDLSYPNTNRNPNPNIPVRTPNLISNSSRRRRFELIRQALLEVDPFSEDSTISHPGPGVHLGITPETRQRLISRARNLIATYRGGRDISSLEDGVNVRQSLVSALASIHDQHRDMRLDVDNMSYEELLELGERIGDVKTGLSEETITDSLKCTKYTFTMKSNTPQAEPCSICREEYAEGEDIGTLDCGHEYHTNCIKQWLVLKNACPICKAAASASAK